MPFPLKYVVALALVLDVLAAPNKLHPVRKFGGRVNPGSYIITLKPGIDKDAFIAADDALSASVTHGDWSPDLLNGFAGTFSADTLNTLRASDDVELIEEDGYVTIQQTTVGNETDAAWGLGRLSSSTTLSGPDTALNYTYEYYNETQGSGVDVYVVDTGINLDHEDFDGRAVYGWSGSGLNLTDDHGHGSHVAGIAGGTRWGVAKQVALISVKVLDSTGFGTTSNVVAGFSYVLSAAQSSGRPSIASASFSGIPSTALDNAVTSLTSAGIHVVVAAGNSNDDAGNYSPSRVASAITVAAMTITDDKASFSNYGPVVDIWAPGVDITSAFIGSTNATHVYSGTSQAAPHITGLAALWIALNGNTDPATLALSIWSTSGVLTDIRNGTVNRLAQAPFTN